MTTNDAIKDLINRYWKFDDQTPMSNWHDKQDLLKGIDKLFESEQPEIVPIGTKVRVTKLLNGHCFNIGQEVKICNYDVEDSVQIYMAISSDVMSLDVHWLSREEFERIEQ